MAGPPTPDAPSSDGFPFSLSLVDGRGVLQLSARRGVGPARLERLALEIPDLRFPFDLSGGVGRFRHRRCRLGDARLLLSDKELLHWLLERTGSAGFGYRALQLHAGDGLLEIAGQAALGEHAAEFVIHGLVQPEGARQVRLALTDLHVFGPFPVPAPLLAAGLLRALGATPAGNHGVRLVGCTDVVLDPLRLVLLRTMAAGGWRLPSLSGVRLVQVQLDPGQLVLDYSSLRGTADGGAVGHAPGEQATARPSEPPSLLRCLALQEDKARFLSCEEAILVGGPRVAADLYRQKLEQNAGHPFVVERLLQLLCTDADCDEEVLRLCETSRARDPDFAPALLAEAAVRSRRGELEAAAESYRRLAERARLKGDRLEELLAALSAGRCALAGDRQRAREDFERVLALDREHEQALASLAPLYAEAAEWDKLVAIRVQQIDSATTPEARLHGHVALGEVYRVHLADPHRARQHYEAALAIESLWEPALRGLAEACIEAEEPMQAIRALDRLCELVAENQDVDAEVAIHLRIASIWEHLHELQSAQARLQRAVALRPGDPQVLRRTATLTLAQGRRRDAVELLMRLLAVVHEPAARQEVHRQLAELWLQLEDLDQARLQLRQALALASDDPAALRIAVRLAERSGEVLALSQALEQAARAEPDAAARSELWVRRGRLLLESGAPAGEIAACFQHAAEGGVPGGAAARRELAALHAREHEWEEARRCWEEVHASGADDAECWNGLGLACLRLGDHARAEEALERALERARGAEAERNALLALWELRRLQNNRTALVEIIPRLFPLLDPIVDGETRVQLLAGLADARRALGDLDGAVEALSQASTLVPADLELLDRLAQLEEERQRWDAARALLERLLAALPESSESVTRRATVCDRIARAAEQQGRSREATDHYRRALSLGLPPRDADRAWGRIVELHLERSDPAAAARAAESWAAGLPTGERRADRLFFAAQIWLRRVSQADEALRCLRAALEQQPHHPGALDAMEGVFNERADRAALVEVLKTKVEAAARRPALQKTLLARLGDVMIELGRGVEARAAFTGALSLDGDYLPALTFLARDAFASQEFERAEIYYRRLSVRLGQPAPGSGERAKAAFGVEVYLRLAELARRRRQHREEEGHLEMALAIDPRHPDALEQLDRLLSEQRRNAELVDVLHRRAEVGADREAAVALELRRADLLDALPGRREDAAAACRHILSLHPGCREALERLEKILRERGANAELISVLERRAELAETLASDSSQARDLFREAAQLAAVALQEREKAAALFRRALRVAPSDGSLMLPLLELLGEDGDADEVDDLLQRLAEVTSDSQARGNLELRLARRLEARGDARTAVEVLSRAIDAGRATLPLLGAAARLRESSGDWSEAIELYERCAELCRERGDRDAESHALRRLLALVCDHLPGATRIETVGRRLLELEPGAREAAVALADLYQGREEWASLVVILEGLLSRSRDAGVSAEEEFRLASRLALALERCERAAEIRPILDACFRLAEQDGSLLWPLAGLARDLEHPDLELHCLEHISVREQKDAELFQRVAELQRQQDKPLEAARSLATALPMVGPEQRPQLARELLLLLEGCPDFELERLALESLRQDQVATPEELLRLSRQLAEAGRTPEALALVEDLAAAAPPGSEARALHRKLLQQSGNLGKLAFAEEAEARAETTPARRAEWLITVAERWRELRDLERAEACALAAVESDPDHDGVLKRAGELLAGMARADDLTKMMERLAASEPQGDIAARRLCGAARLRLYLPVEEVDRLYVMALSRDPACTEALEALLQDAVERDDHRQAAELLRRRAELIAAPDERVESLLQGVEVLHQRLGRPNEALELLQQARTLRPESPRVLRVAADLHQVAGGLEEAESALMALAAVGDDALAALERAAGLAHLRGDAAAEVRYLSHLSRLRPEDTVLGLRLATACRAAGDLKRLVEVLEARADAEPEGLLEAARLCAGQLSDAPAAHDFYRRFLECQPEHREALQAMVELCDALGKQAEAAGYLRRLRDVLPDGERRVALSSDLARREEALGRLDRAAEAWREALSAAPMDPSLIERLSDCLARAEDWEGFCLLLEEKLASAELDVELRTKLATRLGEAYLDRLKDQRAAVAWLTKACSLAPEKTDAAFQRLLALHRQRQEHAEAAELISRRLEQLPAGRRAPLWRELGSLLEMHLKDIKGAAHAYAAAFREGHRAGLQETLHTHELFVRAGELDAGLALLEEAIHRGEESTRPTLLALRARVLVLQGKIGVAIDEYERVLELEPRLYAAHAELGKLRFGQGLFGAALTHLQVAGDHLDDARESATCTFLAGRALEKLGLPDEALAWYERAVARDPSSRPALEALAGLYESRGAWDKLATTLGVLCSLGDEGPARAALLARLASVQRRLGQTQKALETSQRALSLDPGHSEALSLTRTLAVELEKNTLAADLLVRELETCRDPRKRSRLLREQAKLMSERLSRDSEATKALSAALELDPNDREAGHMLLALHEKKGQLVEAAELCRKLAASSSVRSEQKQLLLRAAAHLQSSGRVEDAAQVMREIRPTEEVSRALLPPQPAQPSPTLGSPPPEQVEAVVAGLVPVPVTSVEPREVTPAESVEGEDWWAIAQSYRLRAVKPELPPTERADLLLCAARTLEEKLSRTLEALSVYEEAIAAAPGYLPALEALADAAYRNQDWHRARDLYDRIWQDEQQRQRVELCYRRALIYEALGDEAVADECYARAVALNPMHRPALEGRARLALFRDDVGVAVITLAALERLITVDELELLADLRQRIGRLHLRRGDLARAKEYLQSALAIDPDRIKTIQLLLQVSEGLGDYEAMLELLQRLICLTTDPLVRASLLHHRAEILGGYLGNEVAAIDNLLKAYDLAPEYPPTLWRLVDYYWEQGDLASVAEMGEHLIQAHVADEQPDLRQVRLAAATVREGRDLQIGAGLLRAALAGAELHEQAVLELAHASTIGAPLGRLAELIRTVDESGQIRALVKRMLAAQPDAPGLASLVRELAGF